MITRAKWYEKIGMKMNLEDIFFIGALIALLDQQTNWNYLLNFWYCLSILSLKYTNSNILKYIKNSFNISKSTYFKNKVDNIKHWIKKIWTCNILFDCSYYLPWSHLSLCHKYQNLFKYVFYFFGLTKSFPNQ